MSNSVIQSNPILLRPLVSHSHCSTFKNKMVPKRTCLEPKQDMHGQNVEFSGADFESNHLLRTEISTKGSNVAANCSDAQHFWFTFDEICIKDV
jgi:hypothetical protein